MKNAEKFVSVFVYTLPYFDAAHYHSHLKIMWSSDKVSLDFAVGEIGIVICKVGRVTPL